MFLIILAIAAYVFALDQIIFRGFRIGGFFQTLLIVTAALIVAFVWIGRRMARPRQKTQPRTKTAPARSAQPAAAPAEKVIMFSVAGTTFNNDDGTSRQKILRALKFGDAPYAAPSGLLDVDIVESSYEGELALQVHVNGYMIGHVPKARIAQVQKALDAGTWTVDSAEIVGGGNAPDGKRLNYGCTVTISYTE